MIVRNVRNQLSVMVGDSSTATAKRIQAPLQLGRPALWQWRRVIVLARTFVRSTSTSSHATNGGMISNNMLEIIHNLRHKKSDMLKSKGRWRRKDTRRERRGIVSVDGNVYTNITEEESFYLQPNQIEKECL